MDQHLNRMVLADIDILRKQPYASILCYPTLTQVELDRRLTELEQLQVNAIEFRGQKKLLNIPVLGLGCVGIVVIGHYLGEKVALKIRRVDADRGSMEHEVEMLRKANSIGVGPRFLGSSRNFLISQLMSGLLFPEWLKDYPNEGCIKGVLRKILEQCWLMDEVDLDHGELSRAQKHIMVSEENEPCILDFETASTNRQVSNVTSICNFLFISGHVASQVVERIKLRRRTPLIDMLKGYKKNRIRVNFNAILETFNL